MRNKAFSTFINVYILVHTTTSALKRVKGRIARVIFGMLPVRAVTLLLASYSIARRRCVSCIANQLADDARIQRAAR